MFTSKETKQDFILVELQVVVLQLLNLDTFKDVIYEFLPQERAVIVLWRSEPVV